MKKEFEQAAKRGDRDTLLRLLDEGADLDARDKHGQTLLMNAARRGQSELVELGIDRGADLNVSAKYKLTALMLAIINGHATVAKQLIEAGADLTVRGGRGALGFYDKTALDLARARGLDAVVKAIEEYSKQKNNRLEPKAPG
jgi:uncharacterized protein